jgi:Tat protein secretion system quality control protein TatD with DNase activity
MIFDTHSHCYFEKLAIRTDEIHRNMLESNVTHSVQIGCDIPSSLAAISLARKYANWYATVGYHPIDAQNPDLAKDRAGGKKIHEGSIPDCEPMGKVREKYHGEQEI